MVLVSGDKLLGIREQLLEVAARSGVVEVKALEGFFERHAGDSRPLDEALLDAGIFTEEQVLRLFAEYLGGWVFGAFG